MVSIFTSAFIALFVLSLFSFFYVYALNRENENKPSKKMNQLIFGIGFLAEFVSIFVFIGLLIVFSVKDNQNEKKDCSVYLENQFDNFQRKKSDFDFDFTDNIQLPMEYFEEIDFEKAKSEIDSELKISDENEKNLSELKTATNEVIKLENKNLEIKSDDKNIVDIESEENLE